MNFLPSFRCLIAGVMLLLSGCTQSEFEAFRSVSKPMRNAQSIEFLTINPQVVFSTEGLDAAEGAGILGRATLNRDRFGVILDGLEAMVAAGDPRYVMACFNPGYALRESAPGGGVILICLECNRVKYGRGENEGWSPLSEPEAPELEAYLSGLVKELGLRTYMDPAP